MTSDGDRPTPPPGPPGNGASAAPPASTGAEPGQQPGPGGGVREPAPVGWPGATPGRGEPPRPSPRPDAPTTALPATAHPPAGADRTPLSRPAPAPSLHQQSSASPRPAVPPTRGAPTGAAAAGAGAAQRTSVGVQAAGRKPGRRARLTVKRIDPWSMLKFSFVYSLAGLVVLLVAVVALYAIVDAMGVLDSIRTFLRDIEGNKSSASVSAWLGFGRVLTVAAVVGLINVILFTAFATVTAFIYNVCTDLVGGVEVTLAERS